MKTSPWSSRLLAALFVLVIALPLFGWRFPSLTLAPDIVENRTPVTRPAFGDTLLGDYPEAYEAYFNDNFGFRDFLIQLDILAKYRLFNISGVDKVTAGKDGWLFFTGGNKQAGTPIANHLGRRKTYPRGLFEQVRRRLEFTRDTYSKQGIAYLFVIVPDKWSIYPEYVPDAYDSEGRETYVEQLVQHLREHSRVRVLDLRQALLKAKGQEWPVYLKGGTHWSDLGAFRGANAIIRALRSRFPALEPLSLDDFELTETEATGTGLVNMLGLKRFLKETTATLTPREPTDIQTTETADPASPVITSRQDNPDLPRAVLLRDSFGTALIPFLSQGFSDIAYVWTRQARRMGLDDVYDDIKPQVVIEMRVERYVPHIGKYYNTVGKGSPKRPEQGE